LRILIAEDDVTPRIALEGVLKKIGHEVIATPNGHEALKMLQQPDPPRLAILDWMMPQMDGLEVIRRIRSIPSDVPLYIILLTARDDKSDIIFGLETGADDYLAKPFDPGELRARIEVGRRMVELQEALRAHQKILKYQATHDPLTGLLNRRSILDHLKLELARLNSQRGILAVGMGDIDFFKRFNDIYGHQTGDDILCEITQLFQRYGREHDAFGRIGGEEFLIVAPMDTEEAHIAWFDRLRCSVHQTPFSTKSGILACSMSIGVTCVQQEYSLPEILETVDQALYHAKNQGRNCVVCHQMSA
jgi:diguanylate cyclase (GGDEF)-like protein